MKAIFVAVLDEQGNRIYNTPLNVATDEDMNKIVEAFRAGATYSATLSTQIDNVLKITEILREGIDKLIAGSQHQQGQIRLLNEKIEALKASKNG